MTLTTTSRYHDGLKRVFRSRDDYTAVGVALAVLLGKVRQNRRHVKSREGIKREWKKTKKTNRVRFYEGTLISSST